jgi:hypothetical protein
MFETANIRISPEVLSLIGEIDEFKGAWRAFGTLAPERLSALRRVATIDSIGSSTRIEGSQLSDREVERMLANLEIQSFASRDEQEFTGSENWYRHGINRAVLFTDSAKFLADQGGAYWLLDIIAIAQQHDARVTGEEFQVWNLKVHPDRSATVYCDDGNGNLVYTQEIPFTDFPLDEVKLYFANKVIHLPSEY